MKPCELKVTYVALVAADLAAEAVISQAWADYDMGRLTLRGAMDYLTVLAKGEYEFAADRRVYLQASLSEARDDLAARDRELNVALGALKKLREAVGEMACEVHAALGKITSDARPSTRDEIFEWGVKCGDKLRELCDVADNLTIRPGRDEDYRHVADLLSID